MKDKPDFAPVNWPRLLPWIALAVALGAGSFAFDGAVQGWMNAHQSLGGEHFMREVSKWGDVGPHLIVGVAGLLIALALRSRDWTRTFLTVLLAVAIVGIFNPTIKTLVGRARPNVKTGIAWNGPSFEQKYRSFPSGHTFVSCGFFGALLLERRRLGLALLPIPLLIGFSRLYLSAHHLSDVVCGALLGFACALAAWRIMRRVLPRPNQ